MTKEEAKGVIIAAASVTSLPKALDAAEEALEFTKRLWAKNNLPLPKSHEAIADAIAELRAAGSN